MEYSSAAGRGVVLATTLGSGMVMLDGTVVNVALKTMGRDLGASLAQLQWITNGYLLMLASLILLGGSLGDRLGRRRMFLTGVVWFALASALCGLAPNPGMLIAARVLQGIGGALLTPGSLAIIQSDIAEADRGRAIGAWTGMISIAAAIGPFLGGALVQYADWRWIFWLNAPLAVVTVVVTLAFVPESRTTQQGRYDGLGAEVLVERRVEHPMLPLSLFGSRTFSAANAMTLLVYAALGAILFFLVIDLQTVLGYGALEAGTATLPITGLMLLLAARGGALGARIGPRIPMTVGPLVMAVGVAWLSFVGDGTSYWLGVLPPLVVFALGLALMVAPLTATVLAAAPEGRAGVASGVNNAVARAGSLFAVAALPVLVGLSGADYDNAGAFGSAYGYAMWVCAGLLAAGGVVSWLTIPAEPVLGATPPARVHVQVDCPHCAR